MKETKQEKQHQDKKTEVAKAEDKKSKRPAEQQTEMLIRILSYDIPGSRNLYAGLTRIKGVSWSISNAICHKLKMDKNKKISELSREEIDKIEDFLSNPDFLDFLKNRRSDPVSGKISHLIGSDLDIAKDFDLKRLKKIKSYKGIRHAAKLPVRGQRTRSHFRTKNKNAAGMKRKPKAPSAGKDGAK